MIIFSIFLMIWNRIYQRVLSACSPGDYSFTKLLLKLHKDIYIQMFVAWVAMSNIFLNVTQSKKFESKPNFKPPKACHCLLNQKGRKKSSFPYLLNQNTDFTTCLSSSIGCLLPHEQNLSESILFVWVLLSQKG